MRKGARVLCIVYRRVVHRSVAASVDEHCEVDSVSYVYCVASSTSGWTIERWRTQPLLPVSRCAQSDVLDKFKSTMPVAREWTDGECLEYAKRGFHTATRIYCLLN